MTSVEEDLFVHSVEVAEYTERFCLAYAIAVSEAIRELAGLSIPICPSTRASWVGRELLTKASKRLRGPGGGAPCDEAS